MTRAVLTALCVLICVWISPDSRAHELRPGYLEITQVAANDTAGFTYDVTWKAPIRFGLPLAVSPIFDSACQASPSKRDETDGTAVISTFDLRCTQSLAGKALTLSGLDATLTDVLVRFQPLDGKIQTRRATNDNPSVTIALKPNQWDIAKTYFILGVEHIWFGFDHLLFVLGLVLLIAGKWRIVKTVTAFTLAHSVTLIATSLGWISLSIAPVEAVIALSIVFLATEIMSKKQGQMRFTQRRPWVIAAAFGLLHGFGFAGALSEIGMPETDIPTALFSFNIGVEAGQLVFVAVVLCLLAVVERVRLRHVFDTLASYGMGSVAMFWLIQRLL